MSDEQTAADLAELEQFKQWKRQQSAGVVQFMGRPRLYVCANAHASQAEELQDGKCACGLLAGQYPDNVEWSPAAYKEGQQG